MTTRPTKPADHVEAGDKQPISHRDPSDGVGTLVQTRDQVTMTQALVREVRSTRMGFPVAGKELSALLRVARRY